MRRAQPASDAELLAVLHRDVAAFEEIYGRYVERVAAFAATRCECAADVADVVALTFVRLLDAARRYDPDRGAPVPFVLGIAANVERQVRRSGDHQRAVVARLAGRELLDDDDIERIDAAIDAARAAPGVRDALRDVPDGEQAMLRLVAEGMTPGQASQALGISPAAGWARLSRARRRLRTLLPDPTRSRP